MSRDGFREISAFAILAFAAFLFVSLLTYDQADHYLRGPDEDVANACGAVGAHLAQFAIEWVGLWGAYTITFATALTGLYRFLHREVAGFGWKLTGLAILVASFSALEVAWTTDSYTWPGGVYGQFFYSELLGRLNWFGAYLLIGLALTVAVLISTDLRFYPLLARATQISGGLGRLRSARESVERGLGAIVRRARTRPRLAWPRRASSRKPRDLRRVRRENRSESDAPAAARETVIQVPGEPPVTAEKPSDTEDGEASGEDDEYEYEYVYEDSDDEDDPAAEGEDGDDEYEYEYVDADEDEGASGEDDGEYEYEYEEGDEDEGEYEYEYEDDEDEEEADDDEAIDETLVNETAAGEEEERKIDDKAPFDVKITMAEPVRPTKKAPPRKKKGKYKLPGIDLLLDPRSAVDPNDRSVIQSTATKIEETLQHFKIEAKVTEAQKGPVITQYEVSLAAGIKVHKIVSLADDLSMALEAESIRIVAPIPGKATVGIEVPNRSRATVGLKELIRSREFSTQRLNLPLALGKDIAGAPIITDLCEMPHLLIAGSTGSGKSVAINSIIVNLLLTKTPDEVKVILIDPKMVELSLYEEIPHLLTPVVTDMKKAPAVLNWLVDKMEERYELLARAGVRHLTAYNALGRKALRERLKERMDEEDLDDVPDFLPYIVVIIDELADLMMAASKEIEASITRLSQKSRAVGIHVILATQRPSVDVITGLIKANMPCRISFKVTSKVDSRTILDRNGSEKLLGKGDMLYLPPGTSNLKRAQGTFISDKEINDVVKFARDEASPQFDQELSKFGADGAGNGQEEDELYDDAVRIVLGSQRGSVTLLQRQLQIGYTRASRLMELMNANGLVGPFKGSKAREVYYTLDEWEAARNSAKSKSATE